MSDLLPHLQLWHVDVSQSEVYLYSYWVVCWVEYQPPSCSQRSKPGFISSAFDFWAYDERPLYHPGRATLVNGFVATAAGVCESNHLVSTTHTFISPFIEECCPTRPNVHRDQSNLGGEELWKCRLSSLVCGLGAFALASSLVYKDEQQRFWAFCLFEACVGMYYPVQGMLRGTLISNEHRATVPFLSLRIPLNIFVIVSLLTGASSARRE
ncbi:hypothetical protein BKA70DRAFT_1345699, partial [Coprinopsis sp. MPI-PUGE-AT-0042]